MWSGLNAFADGLRRPFQRGIVGPRLNTIRLSCKQRKRQNASGTCQNLLTGVQMKTPPNDEFGGVDFSWNKQLVNQGGCPRAYCPTLSAKIKLSPSVPRKTQGIAGPSHSVSVTRIHPGCPLPPAPNGEERVPEPRILRESGFFMSKSNVKTTHSNHMVFTAFDESSYRCGNYAVHWTIMGYEAWIMQKRPPTVLWEAVDDL